MCVRTFHFGRYCVYTPSQPNFGSSAPIVNPLVCYWFAVTAVFFWLDAILHVIAVGPRRYLFTVSSAVNVVASVLLTFGCIGVFADEHHGVAKLAKCRAGIVLYVWPVSMDVCMQNTVRLFVLIYQVHVCVYVHDACTSCMMYACMRCLCACKH